jgi:hypothetical protein
MSHDVVSAATVVKVLNAPPSMMLPLASFTLMRMVPVAPASFFAAKAKT